MYKEAFFGGQVSDETKREANDRLVIGLEAVARLSSFSAYGFGTSFTAADCVAYVHFAMIIHTTVKIFGEDMLERFLPNVAGYMQRMDLRLHFQSMMADRAAALAAFMQLDVKYDG